MKLNTGTILIVLISSLFCGIMVLSLGVGAEFTKVNTIMSPVICGGEKLEATWEYNESHPHKAIFDSRWVCVDEKFGTTQDASLKTNLVSGTIYGILIFAAFIVSWIWLNRPENK